MKSSPHSPDALEGQDQCALTELTPGAVIHFARAYCRDLNSLSVAMGVLIHESAHHLGVADEDLATQIAGAVEEEYLSQESFVLEFGNRCPECQIVVLRNQPLLPTVLTEMTCFYVFRNDEAPGEQSICLFNYNYSVGTSKKFLYIQNCRLKTFLPQYSK